MEYSTEIDVKSVLCLLGPTRSHIVTYGPVSIDQTRTFPQRSKQQRTITGRLSNTWNTYVPP